MLAMIFAAGLGTRLKPFTDSHPKALFPLGGKTLLQWQIEMLRGAGIRDIIINVHHFAEQITRYLADNQDFGCNILISDERDALLDTGGGLRKALHTYGAAEPMVACNVDILSNISLPAFVEESFKFQVSSATDALATLVVSERTTQRYLLFDKERQLKGWTNTATGELRPCTLAHADDYQRLAFSGMQVVSPRMLQYMDEVANIKGDKFSLIDLYLHVCERHPEEVIRAYVPADYRMMDMGKTAQLGEAETFVRTYLS